MIEVLAHDLEKASRRRWGGQPRKGGGGDAGSESAGGGGGGMKKTIAFGIIAVLVTLFMLLPPSATAYTIDGDIVYVEESWGKLEAYPHTITSSGWVTFNATPYQEFGELDFYWGFNTTEVQPKTPLYYSPHYVNWTTQHSQFFCNVSSLEVTAGQCDYGNSYNPIHRLATYQVWNASSEQYETATAIGCFDSYEPTPFVPNENSTIFWHTNHSRIDDWIEQNSFPLNHIVHEYEGFNEWWHIDNFPVENGRTYIAKIWVEVPISLDGVGGKYYFGVKRSSESLAGAIAAGHFMALDPWYNASWTNRKQVTWTNVNATTLTNFPSYTNVSDEPEMQADWDDVVFTDSASALIPYELENYTASYADYWVNVTIPASSSVTGWMYYGNDGASSQEDPEGVYDSHTKMVQHLEEAAVNDSAGDHVDSTSNNNDGTAKNFNGTATSTTDAVGKIDGADVFDGVDDYVDCGNDASLNITNAITIEAWVNSPDFTQSYRSMAGKFYNTYLLRMASSTKKVQFRVDADSAEVVDTQIALANNTWHHIVGTYDKDGGSNNQKIYLDGVLKGQITNTGSIDTNNYGVHIGRRSDGAADGYFNGTIDDVRISSTARSVDWINQSYELVVNQSSWVSWGSAEVSSPVITLVSQTPSTLYQNSTGNFNVTWLVDCSGGLNTSSVAFIYTNYYTVDGSYNHSIRVPSNDRASAYANMSDEQILRADNRNDTLNFEDNATITGGNIYEWGGGDENTSRMTITAINSTHSYVYWNGTVQDTVFQNMWYLDRTEQENATMTQYGIYKDHPLLAKIWSVEAIEDHDGYLFTMFADTHLGTILPNKDLEIHYLNESYDPTGSINPEDFDYSFYLTAHNATTWVDYVYSPHNSTYIEAFVVNQTAIEDVKIEVTNTGYLYFTSTVASAKPYYLNVTDSASSCNRSFTENNVTYIGSSAPFSEYLYTPNIFGEDKHKGHQFQMKLFAADNNGNWGNSSLETTSIGVAYYPPTTPAISHFDYPIGTQDWDMDGYYSGTFNVGVGVATDPDGGTVTHNLTIHYANETIVAIINNTFTEADATPGDPHALISFNSTPYHSATDTYTMRVVATDDEGQTTSSWLGVNFTIDVNAPTITETACTPSSVLVGDPVTISCTVTDDVSGVKNVTFQIKDAKDRVVNYTMVAGANNTYSYEFTYTGKSGWYYIEYFRSYDNASNLQENASTLNFSAVGYSDGGAGAGGVVPIPSPTPDVNVTVTPSPPPLEWIRRPAAAISGRDALTIVGGVVSAALVMLMFAVLWNYNKKQKRRGRWL